MTTVERWLPIPGMGGWYDVSDHGNIRSWYWNRHGRRSTPKPITPATHKDGRKAVFLVSEPRQPGVNYKVHVLVMLAFVGPRPEGYEVCHNNGDASDNRLSNLRYDTHQENSNDTVRHGRSPKGIKNGQNVLTPAQVVEIVDMWETGKFRQREIAARYGISRLTVSSIANGYTWGWLTGRGRAEVAA